MLYTKPIDQVTWQDVETFCQQGLAEGAYLDYKLDFPKQLEKTISAIANTLGGIILVGADEDAETMPVLPLTGIMFQRGLSERVTSIILSNITPPLFPETQVCLNEEKTMAVLVIRIAQSHQTPHAMNANTEVYLRTGNRNTPERLATIDEIEWLRDHRKRSSDLRELLYRLAEERFIRHYAGQRDEIHSGGQEVTEVKDGWLTLSLCPLYPKEMLKLPPELDQVRRQISVPDYLSVGTTFPQPNQERSRIVQHGIVFAAIYTEDYVSHTELNSYGLYFYKETTERPYHDFRFIPAAHLFGRLDEFLDSATKFYREIGYWGALQFIVNLKHIERCKLLPYTESAFPFDMAVPLPTLESEVRFEEVASASALQEEKPKLILKAAQRVA